MVPCLHIKVRMRVLRYVILAHFFLYSYFVLQVVEYLKNGGGHVNYGAIPSVIYTHPEVPILSVFFCHSYSL